MIKILWNALIFFGGLVALTPLIAATILMAKIWWTMSIMIWSLW